ncbi:MAG: winged helix-turn-helix domain-containing protein [Candidatus Thermoplasmatota archaeon]|nr:winged helix-turn-helix domain-containing protein [Candidatus Thermoplasmatota archaeon]
MNDKILDIDGVKYNLWIPKNEEKEFEPIVIAHMKDIFGEGALFFNIKKKIMSIAGEKSIPDGYLIDFDKNEFYVIEIELSTHPEYDHINKQVGKFIKALKNYRTRQQIASVLKENVERDIVRRKFVTDKIGKKDTYQYFLENILEEAQNQKFQVVIIIDKRTDRIMEACEILTPKPKILEFEMYQREDAPSVCAHLFEPFYKVGIKEYVKAEKKEKRARKGEIAPEKAYYIPILESLIELGGSGKMKDVEDKVKGKMRHILTKKDYETLSNGKTIRWRNRAEWARNDLVSKFGYLKRDSPRGIWEISEKGERYYKENKEE